MGGKKRSASGIKLAPPLHHAIIVGEKHTDHKTSFTIQVFPQQSDLRFVHGNLVSSKRTPTRHPYTITRKYDDFVQFCQQLHDSFPASERSITNLTSRAGTRLLQSHTFDVAIALPKLNTKRLNLLHNKRQVQLQRRIELDKFMEALFRLPASISQSLVVLEFFGQQKGDTAEQVLRHQQQQKQHRTISGGEPSRLTRSQSSNVEDQGAFCSALRKSASHPELVQDNMDPLVHPLDMPTSPIIQEESTSPLWKRFRNRNVRPPTSAAVPPPPPPAPAPQSTTSSSSLTSLCSQAASMIMPWAGRPQQHPLSSQQHMRRVSPPNAALPSTARPLPSLSTPVPRPPMQQQPQQHPRRPRKKSSGSASCSYHYCLHAPTPPLPIPQRTTAAAAAGMVTSSSIVSSTSTSSSYSHDSQSTRATSVAPSPSTSPTLRMIKFKIVYDVDNIIVIQVPRSVSLTELRSRIMQKFSDPDVKLPSDFTLLFNDTRSSASSNTSAASSMSVSSGTATMIDKEDDLRTAMGSMWVRLDKVTLRCIA